MSGINYEEIINRVCANPSGASMNDQIVISGDPILSGAVWAQKQDGTLDAAMTLQRINPNGKLRGRSAYGEFVFKALSEIIKTPDRYMWGSPTPLLDEDHGGQLEDDELILVHEVMRRRIHTDVYAVIQDVLDGKFARYAAAQRDIAEAKNGNPGKYAQYVAMIHQPSFSAGGLQPANEQPASGDLNFREALVKYFDLSDLYTLCFELGENHENIGGGSKPLFALNMIGHFTRRGNLAALQNAAKRARPNMRFTA